MLFGGRPQGQSGKIGVLGEVHPVEYFADLCDMWGQHSRGVTALIGCLRYPKLQIEKVLRGGDDLISFAYQPVAKRIVQFACHFPFFIIHRLCIAVVLCFSKKKAGTVRNRPRLSVGHRAAWRFGKPSRHADVAVQGDRSESVTRVALEKGMTRPAIT